MSSTRFERAVEALDERTGVAHVLAAALRKVFPDHWSFLLGEIALFAFLILVATGTFLTFFYVPSTARVTYDGSYVPLQGQEVSAAFDSVLDLSFEVRAGLLMRQVHHWTALLFVAAILAHLCRVFFTGAFRKPRELNWLLGITVLTLALASGVTGYTLPDDLLSGTGARVAYSAILSIPFIGPYLASLVFGGVFPTDALIGRFFVLHIMILPASIAVLLTAHIGLVVLQKHTQYRGGAAREDNVVGRYLWPGQAFTSIALLLLTAAIVALFGGLFQINPVWLYGPFDATEVSSPAQPDWYVGWLDGALRLFPPWEVQLGDIVIPAPFVPAILIPGVIFTIVALWPFIEAFATHDHSEHHLLDRVVDHPARTATGVAILGYFLVLTLAGGNDVLARLLHVNVESLTTSLQVSVIVVPVAMWVITYRVSRGLLERADSGPSGGPRPLARGSTGGFEETEP